MTQPQNRNNNEDIPQLVMVKVDQERVDDGAQCTTCLETFELDEDVAKLDCQHIFHRPCIEPWLQRNNTCPICRIKIKWRRDMDAAEELMHHNIETGQAIINAVVARILDPAVDYDNEEDRQMMEDNIAQVRENMDRINALYRHEMEIAKNTLNELNRHRQAFANAQQQMIVQFQEQANGEGDAVEMVDWIYNHVNDGIRLFELYWL